MCGLLNMLKNMVKGKPLSCPTQHCRALTNKGNPCKSYVSREGLCFMHYWADKSKGKNYEK